MAKLITDIELISKIAERESEDNYLFRAYLKGYLNWSGKKLDSVVHEIFNDVKSQIDCAECRNCCQSSAGLENEDIERLAKHLSISVEEFKEQYVERSDYGEDIIRQNPCPFLEGKTCTVEHICPQNCRDYPFLQKNEFRARLLTVVENTDCCPLVFNTYRILKERLKWQKYRRYWKARMDQDMAGWPEY